MLTLRLQHVAALIEAGLVDIPGWLPGLVDDQVAPFPIVASSTDSGCAYYFVGWTHQRTVRRTRFMHVGRRCGSKLTPAPGISDAQLALVARLDDELREVLTDREIEGWMYP